MKKRISASNITDILDISTAQAKTDFSANDLEVIYSGLNPNFTCDLDISGSSAALTQPGCCEKSVCSWHVVKNDLNAPKATYTVAGNTRRFAQANLQLVC